MFIMTATAMHSHGHGLRTILAVPRPSNLCGTVKWVLAFGLSNNNKWRWWMWMLSAIYRQTHSPSRLVWYDDWWAPAFSLHSSNELGELSQWLRYDDSTINIIGSRPSDHYFRSVCLFVCLCRVFLSRLWSDFDQTRTHYVSGSSCTP